MADTHSRPGAPPPIPPELAPGHPLFGLGYAKPVLPRPFIRLEGDHATAGTAAVAEEVPVALVYNGRPHVVMMATPSDFEDLGVGFTLSEQIVDERSDILALDASRHSQGIELQITISEPAATRLAQRSRNLVGRTSCGLCGVELISDAIRDTRAVPPGPGVRLEALLRAETTLFDQQPWNRETGAMHAAAWASPDGTLVVVREDVGRHNALDKVIGAMARSGRAAEEGFIVLTSRASYELVQKTAVAGISLLAAVSRPTGLAIRLAEATGITLVGLLRGPTANVYSHSEGILVRGAPLSP